MTYCTFQEYGIILVSGVCNFLTQLIPNHAIFLKIWLSFLNSSQKSLVTCFYRNVMSRHHICTGTLCTINGAFVMVKKPVLTLYVKLKDIVHISVYFWQSHSEGFPKHIMTFTNYSSIIQAIFTALEVPLCVYLNLPLCLLLENMTFIIPIHICLLQDVIWFNHTTCRYFHISLFPSVIYEFPKCLLCLQVSNFFLRFYF